MFILLYGCFFERKVIFCLANGLTPLDYDSWVKEILDADTT